MKSQVKGVPVLFIPGNAGSYKQVRPIAAEAAQYFQEVVRLDSAALNAGASSLDFFTVDFNEDITAFHGQTLLDQAEYLNEAVAFILSLYHDPQRSMRAGGLPDPTSVVLVGHSMGGIVARAMLTMPNYQSNSINTILTISAPHARPPVAFDREIVRTYARINDHWRKAYSQKWANNNPLWHVTLISVAGGGLDTVIPSDYASLASLVPETHGFTVFTSSVPRVWTGMDHQAILWCDQFRKVLVRAIMDVVNVDRPGQTKPRADRMRLFRKWLLTGMEPVTEKTLPHQEPTTLLTLEDKSNAVLAQAERFVKRAFGGSERVQAHLMPVPPDAGSGGGKRFTLLSDQRLDTPSESGNLEVLFCSVFPMHIGQSAALFSMNMDLSGEGSGSTRLACKNAAGDAIQLPASTRTSKHPFDEAAPFIHLQYRLEDVAEHQFVAIVDKATRPTAGWVVAEFVDDVESEIEARSGMARMLTTGMGLTLPAKRPLVVHVKIPAIQSGLVAYRLRVGNQACDGEGQLFTPLVRQYLNEPYESKFFVNVKQADLNLHGVAPYMPPPLRGQSLADGLALQLWSDPTCDASVDLSLEVDVLGSLGKLVVRYRTIMAAFPLLVVALVLCQQFSIYNATGTFSSSSPRSCDVPLICHMRRTGYFVAFSEVLDLCLRKSIPLVFLALSVFAVSLASSGSQPHVVEQPSKGIFSWRRNATEPAVDFTQNDLLLGSQDPFFWFLVPLFGLISVGACVLLNYIVMGTTYVFSVGYGALVSRRGWIPYDDKRCVGAYRSAPRLSANSSDYC